MHIENKRRMGISCFLITDYETSSFINCKGGLEWEKGTRVQNAASSFGAHTARHVLRRKRRRISNTGIQSRKD
jgi:hypothetical protein